MIEQIISDLKVLYRLKERIASSFDTDDIMEKLSEFENRDYSSSYFIGVSFGNSRIFTRYSNDLDELLDIGNSICKEQELEFLEVTIYQTTDNGGVALYNQTPLGMHLARDFNTDRRSQKD